MTAMQYDKDQESSNPGAVHDESQGHESEDGGGNEPAKRVRRRVGPFKRSRTGCKWTFRKCFGSLTNVSKQVAHARGRYTKRLKGMKLTIHAGGVKNVTKSGRLKVIARGASLGNLSVPVEPTSKANLLRREPSNSRDQRV